MNCQCACIVRLICIFRCKWDGQDCMNHVVQTQTDMGSCVAFNSFKESILAMTQSGKFLQHVIKYYCLTTH